MEFDYLKSDTKRIQKKLEELNKKYSDIEQKNELDRIEERGNEIKLNEDDDFKKKIWADIYSDVLELEKNTVKKNKPQKKKKSDNKK